MATKAVLFFCVQTLLAQYISSQCIGYNGIIADGLAWDGAATWGGAPWNGLPYAAEVPLAATWAGGPCAAGYSPAALAASNGGGFPITSVSPIPVTGVFMTSENVYEGPLAVSGAVPFLGAVALEGALPTAGAGAVAYGCGNGNVAMLTEDIAAGLNAYGIGPGIAAAELGYGYAPLAYEAGFAGPAYGYGCGCGPFY